MKVSVLTFVAQVLTLAAPLAAAPAAAQEKLTYIDLVRRLTDLERLAVLPPPGSTCAQWSSYDRASKFDEAAGKYVRWDANGDGTGIIRREGDLEVMAEMEGPGCIWRIWSARAEAGHVKIYLDGAAEPAVDLPFAGYFDCKNEPFVYPSLVHMTAKGINNYVPIPYARSCKVVAEKGWGRYFQFVYETFPKGTAVPTFSRALSAGETAALKAADGILSGRQGQDPAGRRPGEQTLAKTVAVAAGKAETVAALEGEGAVTALRVKVAGLASREGEIAALRELALRITWDGEARPAIWAPLGDFFGTAPGINKYKSLPLGVTDEGFYSFWYMPYGKGAVIEVANDGAAERQVEVRVTRAPLARPAEGLGRFHAKWHRDALLPAEPERAIDWTILKTAGRGRFLGVMLHVWNPKGGWWGEGDEKFFVDGEKFPSTIGTGSEDYFGYAWCTPQVFENAYHNQTLVTGNRGHVSVNRWHMADNIPFQKSFEGCIEKYYPNAKPTRYACVAYWYLAPGGSDPYEPAPAAERLNYWPEPVEAAPPPKPAGPRVTVPGALEGETLEVIARTGGQTRTQDLAQYAGAWSGQAHLWWTGAKPGDRLDLAVPVAGAGRYRLTAQMTKARDYGIVQLYLDDKKLGGPLDLYNPEVVPTGAMDLGVHDLGAGRHKLTLEITGANEKAVKSYMAAVDYVKLQSAAP
ncbi:MAG: DUF2961 domain-containing protein [Planctomycetes bacterium]|nr:DUF2961 domain-containing protein [Planctomycetota bacterium]